MKNGVARAAEKPPKPGPVRDAVVAVWIVPTPVVAEVEANHGGLVTVRVDDVGSVEDPPAKQSLVQKLAPLTPTPSLKIGTASARLP